MYDDPDATNLIVLSTDRMAFAASLAIRTYSSAVLWPSSHGAPSTSLPRSQICTLYGFSWHSGAQIGIVRAFFIVAVLDPGACIVYGGKPQVHANNVLAPHGVVQRKPLVRAHVIVIDSTPGKVDARRSLVLRSDAVLPVVPHHIIPSGPAHVGYADLFAAAI